jgi:signal transduction histidine kinase
MDGIPLNRRTTSIESVVRSIVELMEPYANDIRVALKIDLDPRLPSTMTLDEDKIAWTLGTLIGNALRHVGRGSFFHPGGTIVVRAIAKPETGEIVIEVSDDGPGIPADKLPLLFQPERTDRRVGYALLLAREIVTAHGGVLEADSTDDPLKHGTTMRILLPGA